MTVHSNSYLYSNPRITSIPKLGLSNQSPDEKDEKVTTDGFLNKSKAPVQILFFVFSILTSAFLLSWFWGSEDMEWTSSKIFVPSR